VVRDSIPIEERQAVFDSRAGIVHVDTKTWRMSELRCSVRRLGTESSMR
jgi:hypothetical protein